MATWPLAFTVPSGNLARNCLTCDPGLSAPASVDWSWASIAARNSVTSLGSNPRLVTAEQTFDVTSLYTAQLNCAWTVDRDGVPVAVDVVVDDGVDDGWISGCRSRLPCSWH